MTGVAELPDDPALLKLLLSERDALIERIKAEAAEQLEAQRQRLEAEKKAEIDALLRRFHGPKSERFDPRQLLLFGIQVDTMPLDESSVVEEAGEPLVTRRVRNRHKQGRQQLPDHLPRIEVEHDLADDKKPCPCCGEMRQRIGREVSEQLEYLPASFKVLRHVRHTYACKHCETTAVDPQIATAAKPPQPIDKGLAGPGLLAYVITSKLGDHLPPRRSCRCRRPARGGAARGGSGPTSATIRTRRSSTNTRPTPPASGRRTGWPGARVTCRPTPTATTTGSTTRAT